MNKVAIVTGGTSGIGLCTVNALKEAGCTVYEISRREKGAGNAIHISADVTNELQVIDAVNYVYSQEGRIDILINNAGFGISGAVEFTPVQDAKKLVDVDFFGVANTTKAVLPIMRENGSGRIVNLSSVAAPISIPFQTYYSVSKAAVSAYTCGLVNEVRPFGISAAAIMPGDIKTGFTAARKKVHEGDDIYCGRISRSVATMEHDEQNGMAPEIAGKYIAKIALKKKVKPFYVIGFQYKLFVLLSRLLPCGLLYRLVGLIYAK